MSRLRRAARRYIDDRRSCEHAKQVAPRLRAQNEESERGFTIGSEICKGFVRGTPWLSAATVTLISPVRPSPTFVVPEFGRWISATQTFVVRSLRRSKAVVLAPAQP